MKVARMLLFSLLSIPFATGCGTSGGSAEQALSGSLGSYQWVDSAGNIYIADGSNEVIRKVTKSTGVISTVAGTLGAYGSTGDGGQATSAKLSFPTMVIVDSTASNLYIADSGNFAIRKVNLQTGIITTVAGTIGVSGSTGDGGPATSAKLNDAYSVAIDQFNNLYITDAGNCAIRKVTASTGIISTVAGINGSCGATGDNVAATSAKLGGGEMSAIVDPEGNIYIADYMNNAIRKVSASTGMISTIAGTLGSAGTSGNGGQATSALFDEPIIGSLDASGNLYVLDDCSTVRKINSTSGVVTLVAGTSGSYSTTGDGGQASAALLYCPGASAFDTSGNLYIADTGASEIRKISASTGVISDAAGVNGVFGSSGTNGQATSADLDDIFDLAY